MKVTKLRQSKKDSIAELDEWVQINAYIECSACPHSENIDYYWLGEDAYDKGWRQVGEIVLCKQCVKKTKQYSNERGKSNISADVSNGAIPKSKIRGGNRA